MTDGGRPAVADTATAEEGDPPPVRGVGGGTTLLREVVAGATLGCIALPFCVSAGVLAYAPLGPGYIAAGAAAGILCAVAGGVTSALARSSSFVPNVPSTSMALIQASFATTLLGAFGGDAERALAVMPVSILLAGIWQALIAASGLVRAVKFTPYPVLAGFVTGISVLTLMGQVPRLFDTTTLPELVRVLVGGDAPLVMPLFGAAVIVAIRVSERVAPRLPSMLVGLVVGTLAWHALRALGPDLAIGRTIGALSLDTASIGLRIDGGTLLMLLRQPDVLQTLLLTSLTIALLGTLDFTLTFRSVQNIADVLVAPRRDLAAQGLSNVAAALSGGVAVTSSLSFAQTIYESGGRTRLSTVSVALLLLVAAAAAPGLIATLPTVVLAAILIAIALKMWDRWCAVVLREMLFAREPAERIRARRNAAIVLGVFGATVLGQPVAGAFVGVGLSCLVFIIEMSRPVVRRRLDAGQMSSKRIRSQAERAHLALRGGRTAVFDLQGVLFFGNADDLASAIREVEGCADAVILDLRRVTDLDTSGATVLAQIARRCRERRIRLFAAGAAPSYGPLVAAALGPDAAPHMFPDLDAALERAEDLCLGTGPARTGALALRIDQTDIAAGLSEAEMLSLARRLTAASYRAGEALCRVGDPADRLWLLVRGSVSVRLAGGDRAKRIAGLGPGTAVGEMGLLDRRPRSADVVADDAVEALILTAEDFDALLRDEPHLGQSILATIARLASQRLRATSDELRLAEA